MAVWLFHIGISKVEPAKIMVMGVEAVMRLGMLCISDLILFNVSIWAYAC